MKLATPLLCSIAIGALAVGCAVRDAKMWQDDTGKVLAAKNNDIRVCYDDFLKGTPNAGGKVTVTFEVETEGGKIQKVAVDKANTTAPDALGECVRKNIEGLVIAPPDSRVGQGTWVYEFSVPPSAPPAKS
jgi:hypothetical protein